nr:reverse transcriptase domain-containing protein [Tanacetum cinerariifolium]
MLSEVKFRKPLADLRIMPPTIKRRNASRRTAAPRGGRTGGQIGKEGGRTGDQGDHISNEGINKIPNDNAAYDSIHEDDRNVNINNGQNGCSYKEFMECKPREFYGKVGVVQTRGREAVVGMTWEDFKALMKKEYCPSKEMQKLQTEFWSHAMVGAEMVAATEPPTIQNAILKAEVLTDEAVRNGSLKKSGEKIGNGEEPSKERNVKGNNKRARTEKVFATITNPVRKEYTGSAPKSKEFNLKVGTNKWYQSLLRSFEKEEPVLIHKIYLLEKMDQDAVHMLVASKALKACKSVRAFKRKHITRGCESDVLKKLTIRIVHVVVWRNKPDLDSMSMDDIYTNLKVYEPKVKGVSSSSTNTQNMAFVSSSSNNNTNISNEAVNTAFGVTTAGTQVDAANSTNIDNLSDAIIYVFLASQSNSSQLINEDLEQNHPDDIEEIDLKWQMVML